VQVANRIVALFPFDPAKSILSARMHLFSRRRRKKIQGAISFANQSPHNKGDSGRRKTMTNSVWNTSSNKPASSGVRILSVLAVFTLASLGTSAELPAGGDEQSGPFLFVSSNRTVKDVAIETKVREALRQDAQLRPLNLGVHMSGGTANLSGPVTSPELKQRAIKIVQRVEGVLKVSAKDLYVSTADPGGKRLSVVIQEEKPTQTRSASSGLASSVLGSLDSRPPAGNGRQITLLAPEKAAPAAPPVPSPKLGEGNVGKARLTANPHAVSQSVSIALAIEQLRRREPRYQQIRARVQGTTVYICLGDATSEDAMAFAQALRRLPGVQHVIIASDPR
jgi:osmotically-inducible protein OsmY